MIQKDVVVQLSGGLEARPAAILVQKASVFDSKVYIASGDKKVNAKSIMGMMSLGLLKGETLTVLTDGDDEKEALESIDSFLSGNDKED